MARTHRIYSARPWPVNKGTIPSGVHLGDIVCRVVQPDGKDAIAFEMNPSQLADGVRNGMFTVGKGPVTPKVVAPTPDPPADDVEDE